MAAPIPLSVDVVSDVVCPWCYIGKKRLETALAAVPEVAAEVRWRPFQLDPTIPPGADRPPRIHARQSSAATPGSARSMRASGRSALPRGSRSISRRSARAQHLGRPPRDPLGRVERPDGPECLGGAAVPAELRRRRQPRRGLRCCLQRRARPAWIGRRRGAAADRYGPGSRPRRDRDGPAHGRHGRALFPARRQICGDGRPGAKRLGRRAAPACRPEGRNRTRQPRIRADRPLRLPPFRPAAPAAS